MRRGMRPAVMGKAGKRVSKCKGKLWRNIGKTVRMKWTLQSSWEVWYPGTGAAA